MFFVLFINALCFDFIKIILHFAIYKIILFFRFFFPYFYIYLFYEIQYSFIYTVRFYGIKGQFRCD